MKLKKGDQKKLLYGAGALVLILMVVFVYGKMQGQQENEEREVDIKVRIKDENGQSISYDPNELITRLHKGLTTRYYFDFSERCEPAKELYNLDAPRFMAAIQAYKTKYNTPIEHHMDACYANCKTTNEYKGESYFDLIKQRHNALKDIIK